MKCRLGKNGLAIKKYVNGLDDSPVMRLSLIHIFSHDNQDIMKLVDQLQFQPDQAIKWGISLLGNEMCIRDRN